MSKEKKQKLKQYKKIPSTQKNKTKIVFQARHLKRLMEMKA